MTGTELIAVTALGASGITALASLGVAWVGHRLAGKRAAEGRRLAAYQDLLSASAGVVQRARTLGYEMEFRSGLKEGFDIALRQRKLVEVRDIYDWTQQDFGPLMDAVGRIWLEGSPEAIRAANDVVTQCAGLLGIATRIPAQQSFWDRFRSAKWDEAQAKEWQEELNRLAKMRAAFTTIARTELKREVVDVLQLHTVREPATQTEITGPVPVGEVGKDDVEDGLKH